MVVRCARIKGEGRHSTFPGASLAGAAKALLALVYGPPGMVPAGTVVQVWDDETPETVFEFEAREERRFVVSGLQGPEGPEV